MEHLTIGQLPAIRITAPDGASATITLYGAHLVSWQDKTRQERLFLSEHSSLDGSRAIRGGVPVIFPQFAARGAGMRHGFARIATWRVARHGQDAHMAWAELELAPGDLDTAVAAAWPHAFRLTLRVEVGASILAMTLQVENRGADSFPFAAALHTYHLVPALAQVRIAGITPQPLVLEDKLDAIHGGVAGPISLATGAGTVTHVQEGFPDAVVWNPGAADSAALADLGDEEFTRFVCIEPALPDPIVLGAGARWTGRYRLSASAA